jgi:hypothetical protein
MAGKNYPILAGNYFWQLVVLVFGGYFCRCCRKLKNHRKLFGHTFGGFFLAIENIIDLVSAVFF